MTMPMNAIIVGMPRSGTSMTAAIFSRAGFYVTADEDGQLRKPDEFNPTGYWEAEPLIQANSAIFKSAGFPHDNTWMYEPITLAQASRINDLQRSAEHQRFVTGYNQTSPWVWKDPRLCYTLGYWWPLMNRDNTRVLLLKRDPKDIYNSFIRVKMRTPSAEDKQDTFQRIKDHMNAAEAAIRMYNIPYIEVHYSDFANDAEATANRISSFFELDLASHDLGFNECANNSNLRGKLGIVLDRIADHIPRNLRKTIKHTMPPILMKYLFPYRDLS